MSVHHTLALDGQYRAYRELSDAARQHGAGALYTTSIPADSYEMMLTEVQNIKTPETQELERLVAEHWWGED